MLDLNPTSLAHLLLTIHLADVEPGTEPGTQLEHANAHQLLLIFLQVEQIGMMVVVRLQQLIDP